jgi:phosphopantetheine adenylyltransferase
VNELRIPTGVIELICTRDEKNVRVRYRSNLRSDAALREQAQALLANLSRSTEVDIETDAATIALTMTFPIVGTAG